MERENASTNGFVPGYGPDCSRCLYRTKKGECIIAKFELGIQTRPEVEGNVCESFEENYQIRFRKLISNAHLLIYNIGPLLPRL